MRLRHKLTYAFIAATALCLAACSDDTDGQKAGSAAAQTPAGAAAAAVRIAVQTVQPTRVVVYDELPGRVSAVRTAEIRPQVTGIVQKVFFTQGSDVVAGQPLFQIDPAPFAADVEAALAVLDRAEADLVNALSKYDRITALAATHTASTAALGDATTELARARANAAEAKANLRRRKLELANATIRSPIAGRIGQALITEGGLASSGTATALATVQQIDSVYLDVRQPSMRREQLEEMDENRRGETADSLPVDILTLTGKPYGFKGRLLFSDSTVDQGTGNIAMRLEVPNPDRQLLPGMYLRARVPSAIYPQALTVPQEAVLRDPSGEARLIVLEAGNTASSRPVELGALTGSRYVILSGLKAGETVVVRGQDRVESGAPLDPVPYQPSAPEPHI
ncbi:MULTISPECIES: efflux RND transporter periplasmic adaptor subunit [unclassified Pannonibacter]|uniref:efflux RND transporter periplasmic adaptor subunit n=1 Tax=unclassified Pannonibacter TaxID=2627228 RepID=UPI001AD8D42F|nr:MULTISPECIES: efflux RND transporter periplasmic adaptor subunit [unclassified Pannonibacter]